VSSVATSAPCRSFHGSGTAESRLRVLYIRQARAANTAHRLKNASARRPRTPSTASAQPFGRVSCMSGFLSPEATAPAPDSPPVPTRLVKDLGRHERLALAKGPGRWLRPPRGCQCEMRFHDLCNRLDVTSTHKSSDFRAQRLRAADRCFDRLPESRALTRAGKDDIRSDAELPLPEGSTPNDVAVGRREHQLRFSSPSRKRPGARGTELTRARVFGDARAGRVKR